MRTFAFLLAQLLAAVAWAGASQADEVARGVFYLRQEGALLRAAIAIELEPGWHLYHGPTAADLGPPDAVGKPTTLSFTGAPIAWEAVRFPAPERIEQDLGFGEPTWIHAHHGPLVLRAEGRLAPGADAAGLVATVAGLACSDETGLCVPYQEELSPAGPGPDAYFTPVDARREPVPFAVSPTAVTSPAFGLGGQAGGVEALSAPDESSQKARATLFARRVSDELQVALEIAIEDDWHLYHGPRPEDVGPDAFAPPTRVELLLDGVETRWSAFDYPRPKRIETDLGDPEPAITYEHEGTIVLRARGAVRSGGGADLSRALRARVTGLACSTLTGLCIPYAEEVGVAGEGPAALFAPFADPAFAALGPASADDSRSERVWRPVEQDGNAGLWLFLLAAVGWGLFTLLMPCTYPMIPITISFFTKQATQREKSAAPLALAYGAGIVAIFILIGVVVGPVIIRFATHPVTNVLIGLLFLLFALALFGALELRPPAFLMNAAGKASSKGGYLGVFLMGATLVVTSFTCTAPFVGSLLSLGATQGGVGRIALGMGVFGLTMAIPFVLLSLLPGKLKTIPKSGEWMHVLKVFLGFVEVAAALKFFSNSDIVWNQGPTVLPRELFLLLWAAIFLAAALFLFGMLRMAGESAEGIGPKRMLGGLASLLFAAYLAYGGLGHPVDPILTAIAPYPTDQDAARGAGEPASTPRARHAIVKDDFEAARALALREGKGLLVNFTGYTCVNCRLMEEKVFPRPEVQAELAPGWVEARLHTDGPPREEENRALQERLTAASGERSVATPIYIAVDPADLRVLARRTGADKPEAFSRLLREARVERGR